ncbi:MAG: CRISPR-associated endonuclease Cas2 [Proteobacteria bacterium]|jgi:CRISPR-associated protein Cas2|nr:CRISPR-associated endonuclease Cas2 [Pseudomonadota bacterium]
MHLVICYDVVSNRRRTKLFRSLKGFLQPVQKSVFEGPVPTRRYTELMRTIVRSIDHQTDTVRVYHLCRGCLGLLDLVGTSASIREPEEDTVI